MNIPSATRSPSEPRVATALGTQDAPTLGTYLDEHDPFEAALLRMVETNRRKRSDYAVDGNIWSNFEHAGRAVGISALEGIDYMVATKQARLMALRANGRSPMNESVADTYLDRAVYAVLALAYLHDNA